jgi:hypothetical protein
VQEVEVWLMWALVGSAVVVMALLLLKLLLSVSCSGVHWSSVHAVMGLIAFGNLVRYQ